MKRFLTLLIFFDDCFFILDRLLRPAPKKMCLSSHCNLSDNLRVQITSFVRKYTILKKINIAFKKFPKLELNAGNGNAGLSNIQKPAMGTASFELIQIPSFRTPAFEA